MGKIIFPAEVFNDDLESKSIDGLKDESPSRGQKRKLGESIRRADGSLGEKRPEWSTLRKFEDSRLAILKRVRWKI